MSGVMSFQQNHSDKHRFLLRMLAAAFVISILITAFTGWQLRQEHNRYKEMTGKHIAITENIGRIMLLDEVLTMSARMCASTGDFNYEKRYDQFDPQLTTAIDAVRALLPQPEIEPLVKETDEANLALVKMERQAFALTHQGKRQQAISLLTSDEYMRLKEIYANGMRKTVNAKNNLIEKDIQHLHTLSLISMAASTAGALLLFVTWFFAARAARAWATERVESENMLREACDELEIRVEQRTADLRNTNEQLQREISERKRVEEGLQKREGLLRTIMGSVKIGINLIDINHKIIMTNPFFAELFKKPVADFIGKYCFMEFEKREAICPHCPGVLAMVSGKLEKVETEGVRDDGSCFSVLIQTSPTFTSDGTINGFVEIVEDITERKKAEAVLRMNEYFLSAALKLAHLGYWEYDVASNLYTFNDSFYALFHTNVEREGGYTMSPAQYVQRFVHPDDASIIASENQKAAETSDPSFSRELEHRIVFNDGGVGYISVCYFIVKDDQGRTIKLYGVNQDITERKMAEEALIRIQKAVESSSDAIGMSDPQGCHFYHNKAFHDLFEYSVEELNKPLAPVVIYADPNVGREVFETIMRGDSWMGETMTVAKGGRQFPVFLRADAIKDDDGNIIGLIGIHTDITEHKQAEEALRESEQKFRALFEKSILGILVADLETMRFSYANPSMCRMFGYSETELLALSVKGIHPKDSLDYVMTEFERQMRGEKTLAAGLPCLRKDGTVFYADINTAGIIIDGRECIMGFFADVTERKQAEEALRESEERFKNLYEKGPIPTFTWQKKGEDFILVDFNRAAAEIADGRAGDYLGSSAAKMYADRPQILNDLNLCFHNHAIVKREIVSHNFAPGKSLSIHFGFIPPDLIVVHTEDQTDRKRMENELHKLNEQLEQKVKEKTRQLVDAQAELVRKERLAMLGAIAAGMGNELRNPLGVMNNAVYFLKTVLPDPDDTIKEYLDIITTEISNSEYIINDLLDSVRTRTPQKMPVTAGELMEKSLGRCRIPENIDVQTDIPDTLPKVNVDPLQMGQVLRNLVTNAVQAMPGGGTLRINAQRVSSSKFKVESSNRKLETSNLQLETDFVEISIKDTGEGISPENMGKLFQPLFTTKSRGIGLGLVVCKNLTEANGGRIEVESKACEGTTFAVVLPVEERENEGKD